MKKELLIVLSIAVFLAFSWSIKALGCDDIVVPCGEEEDMIWLHGGEEEDMIWLHGGEEEDMIWLHGGEEEDMIWLHSIGAAK